MIAIVIVIVVINIFNIGSTTIVNVILSMKSVEWMFEWMNEWGERACWQSFFLFLFFFFIIYFYSKPFSHVGWINWLAIDAEWTERIFFENGGQFKAKVRDIERASIIKNEFPRIMCSFYRLCDIHSILTFQGKPHGKWLNDKSGNKNANI